MESPRYLDERIECLPRPELEDLQEAMLESSLAHSLAQAPLLRTVWNKAGVSPRDIKSVADFREKAPFIDKDMIRAFRDQHGDQSGGLSSASAPTLKGMGFTSGTTGDPTPMPRGARLPYDLTFQRELWEMGARPGDYLSRVMFTFRFGFSLARFSNMGLKPITFEYNVRELPRLFEASLKYRPTTWANLSNGMISQMEVEFDRLGLDPRDVLSSYRGAMFGGEPLGVRQRALCKEWGLELFEVTSLGDVIGAMDCRAHDGFHAWEDFALIESIDPEGTDPVADGDVGELVVSSLGKDMTALLRYRTDDLIRLDRSTCGCGRTHARFKLLGRKSDQMLVEGKSVMPLDVWATIQAQPECAAGLFQMIRPQREVEVLRVRVGHDQARLSETADSLAGRIATLIGEQLSVRCEVEVVENADLLKLGPPHKIPRVAKT